MKTHKITVKRYNHSPASRYVVDSLGLNGKRVRRFFATKKDAEVMKLEWKGIDLVRGLIHVSAEKATPPKRRLVKILPNLAEWLRPYSAMKGRI